MIYLDNAATTKMQECCLPIIAKYGREEFFNPSALYAPAIAVSNAIASARYKLASLLGVGEDTIFFTSSGSESDNQVLQCARKKKNGRIIISAVEHSAIYNTAMELKNRGYDVVCADVDSNGRVIIERYRELLTPETTLVSIMHVNNETGAINPIKELVEITKAYNKGILFHSDGVQAFCKIPVNLAALGVDFYSLSGHKIGAPKGVAALYVKHGLHISPLIYGGGQEKGVRSSTENVAGIVCFAAAAENAFALMPKLKALSQELFGNVKAGLPLMAETITVSPDNGAPHIFTLALNGVRGEVMMHTLEKYGIAVGIGSACSSKSGIGRIPQALGLDDAHREGIIRLSISAENDPEDGKAVIEAMTKEYADLVRYKRV